MSETQTTSYTLESKSDGGTIADNTSWLPSSMSLSLLEAKNLRRPRFTDLVAYLHLWLAAVGTLSSYSTPAHRLTTGIRQNGRNHTRIWLNRSARLLLPGL